MGVDCRTVNGLMLCEMLQQSGLGVDGPIVNKLTVDGLLGPMQVV